MTEMKDSSHWAGDADRVPSKTRHRCRGRIIAHVVTSGVWNVRSSRDGLFVKVECEEYDMVCS